MRFATPVECLFLARRGRPSIPGDSMQVKRVYDAIITLDVTYGRRVEETHVAARR